MRKEMNDNHNERLKQIEEQYQVRMRESLLILATVVLIIIIGVCVVLF